MEEVEVARRNLFKNLFRIALTKREQEIMSCRYGLGDEPPKSIDEVAFAKNISRDDVLKIEKKAMIMLRKSETIKKIKKINEGKKSEAFSAPKKSRRNIYKYFDGYSEELVDEALSELPKEELQLLHERYGEDLKNPVLNEMRKKDLRIINETIYREIEETLIERKAERLAMETTPRENTINENSGYAMVLALK